jgi:hypothetical protein
MATVCPSFLRGTVMRVTRLNSCGQPVYGPCSQVVSDGFITATLSAEIEDGEEITVTKANGKLCVSERACDQLRWYTTEIEFCQVDPDLIQIMNPTWDPVKDANDDTIGYDAMGSLSCDTGFALELWMDTYQATDACSGEGAEGAWGYLLLPWVVGGSPGDLEIGNDAISFTFSGRSKLGSRWRRGPYPVQRDANGAPSPLLRPIKPDTHYRLFVSTVRPPEPECGCQPVDRPIPDPADLIMTRVTSDPTGRTIRLRVDNHGFGPATVKWCDGSTQEVQDGATITKTFAQDYNPCEVEVCDKQTPTVCRTQEIIIPLPSDNPIVALECDTNDTSGQTVKATVTLPPQAGGSFIIDWGDGTKSEEHTVTTGASMTLTHIFRSQGMFRVGVRRSEATNFRGRAEITVPCQKTPTVDVTAGTNPATDVQAQVTVESGKTYTYKYDNDTVADVPGTGAIPNKTLSTGQHTLTVCEKGTNLCTVKTFNVPINAVDDMVVTITCDDAVGSGLGVIVTVDNKGQGQVNITPGDGLSPATNAGDGTAETKFTYPSAGTKPITVTDVDNPSRTKTQNTPVLPCDQQLPLTLTHTVDGSNPKRVTFTASNAQGTTADFDFGDGQSQNNVPVVNNTAVSDPHDYA